MTPTIGRGLIAEASERPADAPTVSTIAVAGARRRLTLFAGIGIAAYVVAMVATVPASVALGDGPWRTSAGGTIWNGEVGLAGGSRLSWRWAPLRSLVNLAFAVDWRASGGSTDLGGRALIGPSTTTIEDVSGAADGTLLQAVQPDLPFTCDMVMQVDIPRARLGGDEQMAAGRLATDAGSCTPKRGGVATPVGPLLLTAEAIGAESRLRLVPATQRLRTLMAIRLQHDGTVTIEMTPEGAAALPFVGLPAGGSITGQI